jgi:hypothetical protein
MEEAEGNVRVARLLGDGAYDSGEVYGFLEGRGIEAVIKPRRNSRLGSGPPARRRAVGRIRELGSGSPAMGGGGLWSPLTRRLSGCLVSLASRQEL